MFVRFDRKEVGVPVCSYCLVSHAPSTGKQGVVCDGSLLHPQRRICVKKNWVCTPAAQITNDGW